MTNVCKLIDDLITYLYLKHKGIETGFGYVKLVGWPLIHKYPKSRIVIGKNVTLVSTSKGNLAGINHPVILATLSENARIELKDNCGMSGSALVCVEKIRLGRYSGLGVNSCVYDTDFHTIDPIARRRQKCIAEAKSAPVIIGDDVWVAANAVILKGVKIGDGAIVGTGSIVTKSIGKRVVAAGNPAKIIRTIEESS